MKFFFPIMLKALKYRRNIFVFFVKLSLVGAAAKR